MKTFSALLAICAGNSPVTGEFPSQRPVTWSFDFFLRLNKRLSKQSWGWWFETQSRTWWRHRNVTINNPIELLSNPEIPNAYIHQMHLYFWCAKDQFTHCNLVVHVCTVEMGQHCFRGWFFDCFTPNYYQMQWRIRHTDILQWNLSATTTSIMKSIACDLFSDVFNWRLKLPIYPC